MSRNESWQLTNYKNSIPFICKTTEWFLLFKLQAAGKPFCNNKLNASPVITTYYYRTIKIASLPNHVRINTSIPATTDLSKAKRTAMNPSARGRATSRSRGRGWWLPPFVPSSMSCHVMGGGSQNSCDHNHWFRSFSILQKIADIKRKQQPKIYLCLFMC